MIYSRFKTATLPSVPHRIAEENSPRTPSNIPSLSLYLLHVSRPGFPGATILDHCTGETSPSTTTQRSCVALIVNLTMTPWSVLGFSSVYKPLAHPSSETVKSVVTRLSFKCQGIPPDTVTWCHSIAIGDTSAVDVIGSVMSMQMGVKRVKSQHRSRSLTLNVRLMGSTIE